MERTNIPVNQRICLSIEEAAEYSLLGENRLRRIIDQDWILHVGQRIRVKRVPCEQWVLRQDFLS